MVRKFTLKKRELRKNNKYGKKKSNKSKRNNTNKTQKRKIQKLVKKGGKPVGESNEGPPCQGWLEVEPKEIIEKLECCKDNGREGLYGRVVQRLINSEKGSRRYANEYGLTATKVIRYTYEQYKNNKLDMDTQLKIRDAFITFQEFSIKTYNLEHVLGENKYNVELMSKDW